MLQLEACSSSVSPCLPISILPYNSDILLANLILLEHQFSSLEIFFFLFFFSPFFQCVVTFTEKYDRTVTKLFQNISFVKLVYGYIYVWLSFTFISSASDDCVNLKTKWNIPKLLWYTTLLFSTYVVLMTMWPILHTESGSTMAMAKLKLWKLFNTWASSKESSTRRQLLLLNIWFYKFPASWGFAKF